MEETTTLSASSSSSSSLTRRDAEAVVRGMYDAINKRDVTKALTFVDDDIVYEDFNFPEPSLEGKPGEKIIRGELHGDTGRFRFYHREKHDVFVLGGGRIRGEFDVWVHVAR